MNQLAVEYEKHKIRPFYQQFPRFTVSLRGRQCPEIAPLVKFAVTDRDKFWDAFVIRIKHQRPKIISRAVAILDLNRYCEYGDGERNKVLIPYRPTKRSHREQE